MVRELLAAGAEVVALVRDWVPGSELARAGYIDRSRVVRGDVRNQHLLERCLGEYEVQTVFHLAAQTIVGVANRNPASTLDTNIRGTWALLEACRRSPAVQQIVVASSDKAYGAQDVLPYTEDTPVRGGHPYDVSKSCADMVGSDVRQELSVASLRHAVWQLLWRRRSELEPDRPRHDPIGDPRRAAGHPLRREASRATISMSRMAPWPTSCSPNSCRPDRSWPAKCSTSPMSAG